MRIAVAGPTHPIKGGISHYTTLLVQALRKQHEVLFVSYRYQYPEWLYPGPGQTSDDEDPIIEEAEFLWHSLKPWTLTHIAKRVREFKADVVILTWVTHFFGWHFATLANKIKKIAGCPVILLCHNVKQHDDKPLEKPLTNMAFRAADGFIVHSQEDMDNLLKLIPDAKVIKNFHPTYDIFASKSKWSRDDARKALGLHDEPMVLFFGTVRPYKGLKWLLDAVPAILEKVPKLKVWVAGGFWDGTGEFEKQLKSLGITYDNQLNGIATVHLLDIYVPNSEVGKFFASSDLVILPYESATQSGIVQIAYGFNKPCIVTNVGGLPEVVLDGVTGYVVPPLNSEKIAERAIDYLLSPPETRQKFEDEISKWRKVFDWEHMVGTIEKLTTMITGGDG